MTSCMILVHTGNSLIPDYLFFNLKILQQLNKTIVIYIIVDKINSYYFFKNLIKYNIDSRQIILVFSENLIESNFTKEFKLKSPLNNDFRKGFWKNTSLRFFLIHDLVTQYSLTNILHIENDYILFRDPLEIIKICELSSDFMVPLDNIRAIPGIVWFNSSSTTLKLVSFLLENSIHDDMKNLGDFSIRYNFTSFPTIPFEYCLINNIDQVRFSSNFSKFNGIFNATAIVQYLDGVHWLIDN